MGDMIDAGTIVRWPGAVESGRKEALEAEATKDSPR